MKRQAIHQCDSSSRMGDKKFQFVMLADTTAACRSQVAKCCGKNFLEVFDPVKRITNITRWLVTLTDDDELNSSQ